tara:strand:+ start:2116 stop:2553 length:438 start_codon:yes stop_codon:yes gene_type:complete
MQGEKLDKFFYFRAVEDEDNDDNRYDSIMLPVDKITGIRVGQERNDSESRTKLVIYFEQALSGFTGGLGTQEVHRGVNGNIELNITSDTSKEIIKAIVDASNAAPGGSVIVIADDSTTDVDGSTRNPKYIHKDILSISSNIESDI